jgi:hypothetical protein
VRGAVDILGIHLQAEGPSLVLSEADFELLKHRTKEIELNRTVRRAIAS